MKQLLFILLCLFSLDVYSQNYSYQLDMTNIAWKPSTSSIYQSNGLDSRYVYVGTTFFNKQDDVYNVMYTTDGIGYQITNISFVDEREDDLIEVWNHETMIGFLVKTTNDWWTFKQL